jgi:4-diphosphocytidyl-2-C-methyl-D-erythritol kinase
MTAVHERAFAKLNLVLQVGRPRADGLHPLCSIFASLALADDLYAEPAGSGADDVDCPGVEGPNLAAAALAAFRERVPALPPVALRIAKRIPVAAGLGGGSADAAAALRAANRLAGGVLNADALRAIAADLGSDVPSQVEPRHALVQGVGELIEPLTLPALVVLLAPQRRGLSAAAAYAELDRMGGGRAELSPGGVRAAAADPAGALDNDLQPAVLALRPELDAVLDQLRAGGALAVLVSGSGPTCFGLFADRSAAQAAAVEVPGAIVTELRQA